MEVVLPYKLLYSFIPCFAYFLVIKSSSFSFHKYDWLKLFLLVLFLIYIYFVFQLTGLDNIYLWKSPNSDSINLALFDTFGEISYFLNIFLFLPFGLFLPMIWYDYRYINKTILLGSSCSLIIELLQLFCGRITDIDDLLMNTLGCFIGYLIWKLCNYYQRTKSGLKNESKEHTSIVGNSPIIWLFLLLFGYLLELFGN